MRVIVISVLLFISVVVGDEGGVAMNPAEEAGIGETVDPAEEAEKISDSMKPWPTQPCRVWPCTHGHNQDDEIVGDK